MRSGFFITKILSTRFTTPATERYIRGLFVSPNALKIAEELSTKFGKKPEAKFYKDLSAKS